MAQWFPPVGSFHVTLHHPLQHAPINYPPVTTTSIWQYSTPKSHPHLCIKPLVLSPTATTHCCTLILYPYMKELHTWCNYNGFYWSITEANESETSAMSNDNFIYFTVTNLILLTYRVTISLRKWDATQIKAQKLWMWVEKHK